MTDIRLDSASAAMALLAYLRQQEDVWVERLGPERLRVNLVGSYGYEGMRMELELRLRAWQEAERARGNAFSVELVDA
jgi:hypothetical protein